MTAALLACAASPAPFFGGEGGGGDGGGGDGCGGFGGGGAPTYGMGMPVYSLQGSQKAGPGPRWPHFACSAQLFAVQGPEPGNWIDAVMSGRVHSSGSRM